MRAKANGFCPHSRPLCATGRAGRRACGIRRYAPAEAGFIRSPTAAAARAQQAVKIILSCREAASEMAAMISGETVEAMYCMITSRELGRPLRS